MQKVPNERAYAQQLFAESKYFEALNVLEQLLSVSELAGDWNESANILLLCSNIYAVQGDLNLATQYCSDALERAKRASPNNPFIATILLKIGVLHNKQSNYYLALEFYSQSMLLFKAIGSKTDVAKCAINMGNVHLQLGNYSAAIDNYFHALSVDDILETNTLASQLLNNLGTVYLKLEDFDSSIKYFQQGLHYADLENNIKAKAASTGNIGGVYYNWGNYKTALTYFLQAIELHRLFDDKSSEAVVLNNIGLCFRGLGEFENAITYFNKAVELNVLVNDQGGLAFSYGNLGALFVEERYASYDYQKAEKYLTQAVEINTRVGAKSDAKENYLALADLYFQMDQGKQAYEFYKRYHELEKLLLNEDAKKKAEQLDYERKTVQRDKDLAIERAKHDATQALLYNVLPPSIAQKMLEGTTLIADKLNNVSVLFADIVNFTQLSQNTSAEDLIVGLDKIFSEFDVLVEKYNLEKIKTIGDAYMVVSGAPTPREDHAQAMALLALEMQNAINNFQARATGEALQIRIGIHCGDVVAGVIGKKKFAYDLWGDAVNIASRMESTGVATKIQISQQFAEVLASAQAPLSHSETISLNIHNTALTLEPRGLIEIKGKGLMQTYFVEQGL